MTTAPPIDRKDFAARILALKQSKETLCLALGTTVERLARIVCGNDVAERTYRRILPRLVEVENASAAYKKDGIVPGAAARAARSQESPDLLDAETLAALSHRKQEILNGGGR